MKGNLSPIDALRPPSPIGYRLRFVANPGISSRNLEGRAGTIIHGRQGRRLVYLRKGRRVVWLEWKQEEPDLPWTEGSLL